MSEQATESVDSSAAFGTSFESALSAAFEEAGSKSEPSNPQPDFSDPVVSATKSEPVAETKVEEKIPDTIDEVVEEEEKDINLPIDEEEEPAKEEEPDTTGMTKSAGERFKQLRQEAKQFKTELATREQALNTAQARIKELEAATGMTEEVKQKLESYELELSVARLESTDAYKQVVTMPLAQIANAAEEIAIKYQIDTEALLDAIATSDQQAQDEAFEEALVGVADRDKMKIYALAEKLPAIMEQRERLQTNSSAALAELDARRETAEAERLLDEAKTRKAAVELVATRVTAKLPFLKESDKFAVDSVKEKIADTNFDALDPTTKAYNAYAGHLVPQLAKAYVTVMKEIESLTDELDKYKKAKPSVKSGSNSVGSTSDSSVDFATAVERAFAGA